MKFRDQIETWIYKNEEKQVTNEVDDESESDSDESDMKDDYIFKRNPKSQFWSSTTEKIWQDRVCWKNLSSNENAIQILEKNASYINIGGLCKNPNAIHLVEQRIKLSLSIRYMG